MTTPSSKPSGAALDDLPPSSSFLQQLLEEINGSATPTVLRDRTLPPSTPSSGRSSNGSRRPSSLWVGGDSAALNTREKLRAADEARMRKSLADSFNDTPRIARPDLHLYTHCFESSSSPGGSSSSSSPHDAPVPQAAKGETTSHDTYSMMRNTAGPNRLRPKISGSHLPVPTICGIGGPTGQRSPLFFCDADSDLSATPSPIEEPMSAISEARTDATTMSEGHESTPSGSESFSPPKRQLDQVEPPEPFFKKIRTVTPPTHQLYPMTRTAPHQPFLGEQIGGDNRRVIRGQTFTERRPALVELTKPHVLDTYPELSSFRPEAVDAQGVPFVPVTPVRLSRRHTSMVDREESPLPAETPIYARSLHLIDTDVSIYQKTHGDEWRENSLCLHCFRQHGDFRRLGKHGYEVCGDDEALKSHYWESGGYSEEE